VFGVRKWSPRLLALYIVVTVLGGAALVVFLTLLGLYYWIQARVPLPDPRRLIQPGARAYLVVRYRKNETEARPPLAFPLRLLTRGLPTQAARLIEKGAGDSRCDLQVVLSSAPAEQDHHAVVAVSLGAYPGLFHLVRRDIERRCKKGLLRCKVSLYRGKAVFSGSCQGLKAFSMARCSVVRASSTAALRGILDRLLSDADLAGAEPPAGRFAAWGWARSWEDLDPVGAEALLRIKTSLAREVPALVNMRNARLRMDSPSNLRVSFQPGEPQDAPALSTGLLEWLERNGSRLGLSEPRVAVRNGRVEVSARIDLGE